LSSGAVIPPLISSFVPFSVALPDTLNRAIAGWEVSSRLKLRTRWSVLLSLSARETFRL